MLLPAKGFIATACWTCAFFLCLNARSDDTPIKERVRSEEPAFQQPRNFDDALKDPKVEKAAKASAAPRIADLKRRTDALLAAKKKSLPPEKFKASQKQLLWQKAAEEKQILSEERIKAAHIGYVKR